MLDSGSKFGSYRLGLDDEELGYFECSFLVVRNERRIRIIAIRCRLGLDVSCRGGVLNGGECCYKRAVCVVNLVVLSVYYLNSNGGVR